MWRLITAIALIVLPSPPTAAQQLASAEFDAADVHVSREGATESGGFLPGGRVEFRATTLLHFTSVAYSVRPGQVSAPKVSSTDAPPECKRSNEENLIVVADRNTTMAALAENLPSYPPGYFGLPVVDRTGLPGAYDFKLEWVGRGLLPPGPEGLKNSLSLFSSIEKQLGVKVEQQTAPAGVLAIGHVNRAPLANPPGVAEKPGPAPTAFEVSDVNPSRSGENEDFKMENGRMKERFGLKVHRDRQPINVYALTALKPKLKEADPSERSRCTMSRIDGNRTYTCQNVTMTQFAGQNPAGFHWISRPSCHRSDRSQRKLRFVSRLGAAGTGAWMSRVARGCCR